MKLTPPAAVISLGILLVSCGEAPESGPEAAPGFELPHRDPVRVETHLTRPEETIKTFEPGHGADPGGDHPRPGDGADDSAGKAIP